MSETAKELIAVQKLVPSEVFTPDGIKPVLAEIDRLARDFVPDTSTAKGRKQIKSMAARVSRTKTFLDDVGKKMVKEWKDSAKRVDNVRKYSREYLDNLKADVRKPLTEWEAKEQERIDGIQDKIAAMKATADEVEGISSENIQVLIDNHESTFPTEEIFQELLDEAITAWRETKQKLVTWLQRALIWEDTKRKEAEEKERLAKERAEQERIAEEQRQEAERQRKEAQRLEEEREQLREQLRQQEEARRAVEESERRIEEEKRAEQERKDRAAFEEKAREEARIQAEQEAAQRAEEERLEKEAKEAALLADKELQQKRFAETVDAIQEIVDKSDAGMLSGSLITAAIQAGEIPNVRWC